MALSIFKSEKESKKYASQNNIFRCVTFHLTIAPYVTLKKSGNNLMLQFFLTNAAIVKFVK